MKYFIILLFCVISLPTSFSQNAQLSKGELLNQKADSLLKIDPNRSIQIAKTVINQYSEKPAILIKSNLTLSYAYKYIGEYDSAIYFSTIGIQKALEINDTIKLILLYSARGIFHYMKADYSNVLIDFSKAKDYYQFYGYDEGDEDISARHYAKILNNIATAYIKTSQYDSALVYFIESLKIREKDNASAKMLLVSKYNIGSIYLALDDNVNGKVWISNTLDDALELKDSNMIAKCYSNLGIIYKRSGDSIKAIDSYQKGLEMHEKLGNERDEAIVLQNLALLFLSQKKYNEASNSFYRALSANNNINTNNAAVHLGLCNLYFERHNYDSSIFHGKQALILAYESGNTSTEIESYLVLYKAYKQGGKYRSSLGSFEKYLALKDSVFNKENQEYIQKLKEEFETERKEKEIAFLKRLNESEGAKAEVIQSRQMMIIIIALLALALLIVISVSYFIKKKKEKEIHLTEKKLLEVELKNKDLASKEFQTEVRFKTKQLTTHALNMIQKNQMLEGIIEKLDIISKKESGDSNMACKSIIMDIKQSRKTDSDWGLFKKYFESVNTDFNVKLRNVNPKLSTHDYRLAALISLNLNIKETAALLNISPDSVKLARHRLRKRLGTKSGENLYTYLSNL